MTALPLPVVSPADLTHLDEDWAVPCERYPEYMFQCDALAEWIAFSVRCCPDRWPAVTLCTPHKDELCAGMSGLCSHCGQTFMPTRAGFRLIEPLNRRTT